MLRSGAVRASAHNVAYGDQLLLMETTHPRDSARDPAGNISKTDWLDEALEHARRVVAEPYIPSREALDLFDQRRSMLRLAESFDRPLAAVG
jgi:hypothetical protein